MAQFIAFNPNVEVDGGTVLSFVNSMKTGQEKRQNILSRHGIFAEAGSWFNQQKWLDAFKEVATSVGDLNLFLIGTAIIDNAQFPPISNLEEGLRLLNVAYHMNHRLNGEIMFNPQTGVILEGIGHYSLVEFDAKGRKAVMVCNNPYPSKFDEGIITQLVKRFKPADSTFQLVKLDITKETRAKGAESCTYLVSW